MILNGKEAAAFYKEELKKEIMALDSTLNLAIVHFNMPSSASYLKGRLKLADELGINVLQYPLPLDIKEDELVQLIIRLNKDSNIHGIIIDRPLPEGLDEHRILNVLDSKKDIDGFTSDNLGRLFKNENCFMNPTPYAALALLDYYKIDVASKNVLVIGRSINVGKPLSIMLLNRNATVTIAHSKTLNIKELAKNADIVFIAIGKADFLTKEYVNSNTIVVDIGINFKDGHLVGDASSELYDYLDTYSPVPGGVGVLTNVILFMNLLKAYKEK